MIKQENVKRGMALALTIIAIVSILTVTWRVRHPTNDPKSEAEAILYQRRRNQSKASDECIKHLTSH